jgi:uncharacterized membrane protein
MTAALVAFYLIFPALVIWLCYRFPFINKIGAVIICYIVGIALGNIGLIPAGAFKIQQDVSEAAVALAIPLLLFSMDVRRWLEIAGKAIFSMLGATLAILAVAGCAVFLVRHDLPEAWKLGGMAIGVYTGGTPNLAAIKEALHVDATTFVILHTYDTVISLIYIVFCMTAAQPLFNRVLPRFKDAKTGPQQAGLEDENINSYVGIFSPGILIPLAGAAGLVLLIVAASLGLIAVLPKSYATAVGILAITTGGIAGSFIPKIRRIRKTFQAGMYLIFIFCLVVGSMANLKDLVNINWPIMFLVVFCIAGSFLLHAVFCRIFKIDTDTFIITSVSAVCSPPFVPPVAGALNNKEILLSGITTGIIGYAVGNYLGISFAYLFHTMIG